ncbi:hypothetical protein HCC30_06930 [Streptomyces sp. HNM0574]|nr:sugar-binding protein [Streptomyces sp. HNM0574]NLU67003.1 hypothetical protein [Streptomyces sp. HNM0574]
MLPAAAAQPSGPASAAGAQRAAATSEAASGAASDGARKKRAHTDVLFIGAHPDDEFQSLSTFGQWAEKRKLSTGVVTITRGEGGGNAVGNEEGAPLGMLREAEEREAVRLAGVRNVFYLDKPDFWYTLSAPLTSKVWDREPSRKDTLERLVRLIRATTPKTVVTMDPRPFDQHGGHQLAGRLATEAFELAGNRKAFPHQITKERYKPWQPSGLLAQNWRFQGPSGKSCATSPQRDEASGLPVRGWWGGVESRKHRTSWAQVERDAQRKYVSQGFGSVPEKVTEEEKQQCDWFTVLAEHGKPVKAKAEPQSGLKPVYAEFARWARDVGMPWLANKAQPDYPERPGTTVPMAAHAPAVDGKAGEGEYPGDPVRLDHWQGEKCATAQDCSAEARLSHHGDALYALVHVTDDKQGTKLGADDCKRHWRTDSVELALDPKGTSDDTSTVFKTGLLPFTDPRPDSADAGGPCAARDADNRQGPAARTAPGLEVASQVTKPYKGYTVEVKIPYRVLPATVDPTRLTANVMVYDSDTDDKTGQTRLAWATFGSAQADPYVWGRTPLLGAAPPAVSPSPPDIPLEAAKSIDSPASVKQSKRTGVPLAGGPRA